MSPFLASTPSFCKLPYRWCVMRAEHDPVFWLRVFDTIAIAGVIKPDLLRDSKSAKMMS